MSNDASNPPPAELPAEVLRDWWQPFGDYLALERRYSAYTVRNYRQAFEDFYRWLADSQLTERGFDGLATRDTRDFVIEAQRRFGRRTLHNHVSGLRAFYKYWLRHGRVSRNPFLGVPLPVWLSALLAAAFAFVMRGAVFGRQVYAIGGNEVAARFSGLRIERIRLAVYTVAGALAGNVAFTSGVNVDPR